MNTYILYKRSKNEKIQQWSIEIEGGRFRTTEGFIDGAQTTSEWTVCAGKSIGKANETSPEQQAAKEVTAKIQKQKSKGYTDKVEDVDSAKKKIDPMLAHKWDDHKDYALSRGSVASQPKLDGIRCEVKREGLFTRNGKPILTAPHIHQELLKALDRLPAGFVLDGELYNHELKEDFNKIASLVRKQNPNEEELTEAEKVLQFHWYDIDDSVLPKEKQEPFVTRNAAIYNLCRNSDLNLKYAKMVPTEFLGGPTNLLLERMDLIYGVYLEEGYEGQMIRVSESTYQAGRTKDLLKRKEFQDGEFTIIDIEEGVGNRSGMMGRIKFEGFDSNARGSHEYFRELLKNKKKYIGKQATVRYQNLTPDGKPRFPVMVAIRNYE